MPAAHILLGLAWSVPNLWYSRTPASAPIMPKLKKINPVTSSQRMWKMRPKEAAVARAPDHNAPPRRLRPACSATTRAANPIFLAVKRLVMDEF